MSSNECQGTCVIKEEAKLGSVIDLKGLEKYLPSIGGAQVPQRDLVMVSDIWMLLLYKIAAKIL